MGPIWGREDPGEPHIGPMNFAIWDVYLMSIADFKAPQAGNQVSESVDVLK